MRTKVIYITVVFIFALTHNIFSQGFLKTNGKQIVDESGKNILLRGMGLGGWMLQEGYMLRVYNQSQQHRIKQRLIELTSKAQVDEFYDMWLANHTRKIDVDSMKSWGFNSVRLPMHYNLYTLPVEDEPVAAQNTWLEKGFRLTDSLLSWCKANNMYLILDLHAAPGGQGNDVNISDRDTSKPSLWQSEANRNKTIALWKKLAQRYANEPWIAAYDIINEPNWGFEDPVNDRHGLKETKNEPLKKLMVDITKAIREVDKKHIIIIEGNGWGNNYNGILPPWDDNMVLSFHKYWNRNTEKEIQTMLGARDKYNVPVWLGETGENSNVWFTQAIRLLERNNIGWAWWPLKKLGANNPLEIIANHNWMQVVRYFNGQDDAPKESDVYSGMIELAIDAKLENCIFHKDVIDAMFRQVYSDKAIPFKNLEPSRTLVVNAVDYDLGRNKIAYFDKDTVNYGEDGNRGGNKGNTYRNDGVDIRKDSARFEQYYVSDIEEGEWLQFSIPAASAGKYSMEVLAAAEKTRGAFTVSVNGKKISSTISVPVTGEPKNWKPVNAGTIQLKAGLNQIRIIAASAGFNLYQLKITKL